jgi:hypothetical protein
LTEEVFDNKSLYHGNPDGECTTENRTFGIVTECINPKQGDLFQPQIIKLDIGMGRGQEYMDDYKLLQQQTVKEIDFFKPRAPQLMEIMGAWMRIHRSTMENMSIHMKRDTYRALSKPYESIYDVSPLQKISVSPLKEKSPNRKKEVRPPSEHIVKSPRKSPPKQISPRQISPRQISPRQISPRQSPPKQISPVIHSPYEEQVENLQKSPHSSFRKSPHSSFQKSPKLDLAQHIRHKLKKMIPSK